MDLNDIKTIVIVNLYHLISSDIPNFIPFISKYGTILECNKINYFTIAAYLTIPNKRVILTNIHINNNGN